MADIPRQVARRTAMETILGCCAGLDVHKDTVEACVRRVEKEGRL